MSKCVNNGIIQKLLHFHHASDKYNVYIIGNRTSCFFSTADVLPLMNASFQFHFILLFHQYTSKNVLLYRSDYTKLIS